MSTKFNMATKSHDELVAEGKQKYENADTKDKLDILLKMGKFDSTCVQFKDFHSIINQKKPLTFVHIGTTGLKDGSKGEVPDEITQFSALTAVYDNSKGQYVFNDGITLVVEASDEVIKRAEAGTYDIFANGGFDLSVDEGGLGITKDDYKNHIGTISKDNAKVAISDYMLKHQDSFIVGFNKGFDEKFLKQLSDIELDYDLQKVVPEFDYMQLKDGDINARPINETNGKYTLENIANNISYTEPIMTASSKCKVFLATVNEIGCRSQLFDKDTIENDKAVLYRDAKLKEYEAQYGNLAKVPTNLLTDIGVEGFRILASELVPICDNATKEKISELATRYDTEMLVSTDKKTDAVDTIKDHLESKLGSDAIDIANKAFQKIEESIQVISKEQVEEIQTPTAFNGKPLSTHWNNESYSRLQNYEKGVKVTRSEAKHISADGFFHTDSVSEGTTAENVSAPTETTSYEMNEPVRNMNDIYNMMQHISNQLDKLIILAETKTVKKTIDKTEKEREANPVNAMPSSVIVQDLKGHEFEEEEEYEMSFKGTTA